MLTTTHSFGIRPGERDGKMKVLTLGYARRLLSGEPWRLSILEVTHCIPRLGRHAFYYVLSRKPTRYGMIIEWLSLEIRKGKYRRYLRKFRRLVREGQAGLQVRHVAGWTNAN